MYSKIGSAAINALLNEYDLSIAELKTVVEKIPDAWLPIIINTETTDENCKSIQSFYLT